MVGNQYVPGTPDWVKPYIDEASRRYGIPSLYLSAQINLESGFKPTIQGYNRDEVTGAIRSTDRGIAQINDYWHPEISDEQANDPQFAIDWMAKTMMEKEQRLGDYGKALSEYNTGNSNGGFSNGYVSKVFAQAGVPYSPPSNVLSAQSSRPTSNLLASAQPMTAENKAYSVKSGDTLWGLAQKFLGQGNKWQELGFRGNPKAMAVGTQLNIPAGRQGNFASQIAQRPITLPSVRPRPNVLPVRPYA